jgi:hypothetical protein
MMSKISNVVAEIIAEMTYEFFKKREVTKRTPKIIVVGLTKTFIKQYHGQLLNHGIRSYLIVRRGEKTSEAEKIISEASMTSVRNGKEPFVYCVPSDMIATLPDSITRVIRNKLFSEDWPWSDDDPEISFWGPMGFMDQLLIKWNISDPKTVDYFKDFVRYGVLLSLNAQSVVMRRELLFDELLGNFHLDNALSDIEKFKSFVLHTGVPWTNNYESSQLKQELDNTKKTGDKIYHQLSDENFSREDIKEFVDDTQFNFTTDEKLKYINLVDIFIDGLLSQEERISGSLIFYGGIKNIYKNSTTRECAKWLTRENIHKIFKIKLIAQEAYFQATFDTPSNDQKCSEINNVLVSGIDTEIAIKLDYNINNFDETDNWYLTVKRGSKELCKINVVEGSGTEQLTISTEDILGSGNKYKKEISLSCLLNSYENEVSKSILKLNLIGPERPFFVGLEHSLKEIKNDGEEVILEQEFLFVRAEGHVEIKENDRILHLQDKAGGCSTKETINPSENTNNTSIIEVNLDDINGEKITIGFTISMKEMFKGEHTLDLQLQNFVENRSKENVREVLAKFTGKNTEPYLALGGMDNLEAVRLMWGKAFEENNERGSLPLIVDISEIKPKLLPRTSPFKYVNLLCTEERVREKRLNIDKISNQLNEALTAYNKKRSAVINAVKGNTNGIWLNSSHPLYARTPTYCKTREEIIEKSIADYLDAYSNILKNISSGAADEFIASYLDCVYCLDVKNADQSIPEGICILGPWHPITTLYRYWVQKILSDFTTNFVVSKKGNKTAAKFAKLSRGSSPIAHWESFNVEDGNFSPSELTCSKDTGWIVSISDCVRENFNGDTLSVSKASRLFMDKVGLPILAENIDFDKTAKRILDNYVSSFPFDRCMELDFGQGYNLDQISKTLRNFSAPTDTISKISNNMRKLPGGIKARLDFKKAAGSVEFEELSEQAYPIYLIRYEASKDFRADIDFRSNNQLTEFKKNTDEIVYVHRGNNESQLVCISERTIKSSREIKSATGFTDKITNETSMLDKSLSMVREALSKLTSGNDYLKYISTSIPPTNKSPWIYVPASGLDPQVIKKLLTDDGSYVNSLWEFKVDLENENSSYFLLSSTDAHIKTCINRFLPKNCGTGDEILKEMNQIGVAISAEARQSTTKAKGCVGTIGAVRLFNLENIEKKYKEPENLFLTLLPVDPFVSFFSNRVIKQEQAYKKLCDLLLIEFIYANSSPKTTLEISVVGIEAKYRSNYDDSIGRSAIDQASETYEQMKQFVALAKADGGIPFKVALVRMCEFSMRLRTSGDRSVIERKQKRVLASLAGGNFKWRDFNLETVAVISHDHSKAKLNISSVEGGAIFDLDARKDSLNWPQSENGMNNSEELKNANEILVNAILGFGTPRHEDLLKEDKILPANQTIEILKPQSSVELEEAKMLAIELDRDEKSNDGIVVNLGHKITSLGKESSYFTPSDTQLTHLNIGVLGDMGNGKTQLLKSIMYQFHKAKDDNRGKSPKFFIFDYKKDFTAPDSFTKEIFIDIIGGKLLRLFKLPINFFALTETKEGEVPPLNEKFFKARAFIDIILKIYPGAGPVQEARLLEAIDNAYNFSTDNKITIYEVFESYRNQKNHKVDSVHNALKNLTQSQIFESDHDKIIPFSELFSTSCALYLKDFDQDKTLQAIVVTIFMNLLSDYMKNLKKMEFIATDDGRSLRGIDSYILIDEAHNAMKYGFSVLMDILVQGREFGVGVILSSQYLSQFTSKRMDYSEPLLTWFIHSVRQLKKAELKDMGIVRPSEDRVDKIRSQSMNEALYKSYGTADDGDFIRVLPFWKIKR